MQTLLSDDEIASLDVTSRRGSRATSWRGPSRRRPREAGDRPPGVPDGGTVVIHMATRIRPGRPDPLPRDRVPVRGDAGVQAAARGALSLNVIDLVGEYSNDRQEAEFGARLFERNPEMCCEINKVRPMFEALRGLDAWVTSVRRDSSPTRADTPIVERYDLEPGNAIVKVNPMANWTKPQVWRYLKEHDLPHNPLYDLGYSSIGCAPCTRLRFAGEPERAGRWAGSRSGRRDPRERVGAAGIRRAGVVAGRLRRRPRGPRGPASSPAAGAPRACRRRPAPGTRCPT